MLFLLAGGTWAADAGLVELPTYGFAVKPPAGWTALPRDKCQLAGFWALLGRNGVEAIIMIEAAPPADPDPKTTAQGLAVRFNGRVLAEETTLDGERAYRVRGTHRGEGVQPVEAVVAFHNGLVHMLMGGIIPGQSCQEALEGMRASWKWIDMKKPSEALALDAQARVPKTNIILKIPSAVAFIPPDKTLPGLHLALPNIAAGKDEFLAHVVVMELPAAPQFEDVTTTYLDGLNAQIAAKPPMKWARFDREKTIAITTAASAQLPGRPRTADRVIFALRKWDKTVVQVNFTIRTEDERTMEIYTRFCGEFVDAIVLQNP